LAQLSQVQTKKGSEPVECGELRRGLYSAALVTTLAHKHTTRTTPQTTTRRTTAVTEHLFGQPRPKKGKHITHMCLWGVFVWGFGVLFLSCVCVCRCRVVLSLCVCVCDLLIYLYTETHDTNHHKRPYEEPPRSLNNDRRWRGDGAYHLPHPGGWPRLKKRQFSSRRAYLRGSRCPVRLGDSTASFLESKRRHS